MASDGEEAPVAAIPESNEMVLPLVMRVMARARWKREHTLERRNESRQNAKRARVDEVRHHP